jgi:hypothetical protein
MTVSGFRGYPRATDRMAGRKFMTRLTLSATPKGNGYQATVSLPDGVTISSAETYPTVAEAITAAALKVLEMPERLEALARQPASA